MGAATRAGKQTVFWEGRGLWAQSGDDLGQMRLTRFLARTCMIADIPSAAAAAACAAVAIAPACRVPPMPCVCACVRVCLAAAAAPA